MRHEARQAAIEQARAAVAQHRALEATQRRADTRQVLSTPEGRRLLSMLLADLRLVGSLFSAEPAELARRAGLRDHADQLEERLRTAAPDQYADLRSEELDRQVHSDTLASRLREACNQEIDDA